MFRMRRKMRSVLIAARTVKMALKKMKRLML